MPETLNALISDEISAIVGDESVLEYYAHQPVDLVGTVFSPDKYDFAFPRHHEPVKPTSVAIIRAHESEEVAKLKDKYFGPEN